MLNPNDLRNLEELLSQTGRTKVKIIRIDAPEIGSGDFLDEEEISVVRNGVVETQVITHARLLDCGHLGTMSSIVAACDLCGRLCCEMCIDKCQECGFLTCRYCLRKSINTGENERTLCHRCRTKENRRQVARAVAGFFVKREVE